MRVNIILLLVALCFGCSKPTPRRPINPKKSTTLLTETIKQAKEINSIENDKIAALIKKDTATNYIVSSNGFWYIYKTKIEEDLPKPKIGDDVVLTYNITDLNDSIIYSKEDLGIKKYKVDKEDFIPAIQTGIKLMKEGETITFVIPSYSAFGITGDGNKIGINTSIKSTVTLIKIN
jgi:gliding motility-associated peptidyl-prolyl isomerase